MENDHIYKCTAKNVAGEDFIIYNVGVVTAPVIEQGGTIQVVEGEDAVILCNARGEPPPTVFWERNARKMTSGMRVQVDENAKVTS